MADSKGEDLFVGNLAPFAGLITAEPADNAILAADLGNAEVLDALIDTFGLMFPHADRHAVVSFWSQYYFRALIIPAVVFALAAGRDLRIGLADTSILFCPQRGTPLSFQIAPSGKLDGTEDAVNVLAVLFNDHLAPLIRIIRGRSGLSSRLLWENASGYLVWCLAELCRSSVPLGMSEEVLLSGPAWSGIPPALLASLRLAPHALQARPRRACCLRHRLPGLKRCEGICPLASSRRGEKDACAAKTPLIA